MKAFRREVRRELARAAADPEIRRRHEQLVSELRAECYYVLARWVDEALAEEGFGPKRRARIWGRVMGRALWAAYMEQGLPLQEAIDFILPRRVPDDDPAVATGLLQDGEAVGGHRRGAPGEAGAKVGPAGGAPDDVQDVSAAVPMKTGAS